ncbi:MAG: hypothetical protein R3248_01735 [Candidatus Promineifilaceae bacterium]|nr:hypothetical protein [Candidatus Promineifilaceae bacterium]
MNDLQAVTGQLYIVEGEPQEVKAAPGLLAQSPPGKAARGRARDSLFVHLSLTGRPEETENLAQDLLDAISKRFYETAGSVTSALRNAILEANRLLLRRNMSRTGPTREGAVTCAVLRGEELYVVQSGEALALIGRNFGVERLPTGEPAQMTPLGRTAGPELRYFHNWLEPGDMLLLLDPRLAHLPAEQVKPVLVDSTVEDGIPQMTAIIGEESGRLLLIEFTDEPPVDLPETRVSRPEPAAPPPSPSPRTLPPPTEKPLREGARPGGKSAGKGKPRIRMPDVELPSPERVEDTARRATSQTARGLSRATGWLAELVEHLRPPRDEEEEETPAGWALPALLVILIPVLVAVVVGGVYVQRGRVTRASELRQEMRQLLTQAEEASTEAEQRAAYNEVLALAQEAELLRPGNEEVERLRQEALRAMDRLEEVTRLTAQPLYRYEEGTAIRGVTLRGGLNGDIYTLDGANNRVLLHETEEDYVTLTAEEPQEIIFGGQAVGSHVVGALIDMFWRPSGTQASIDGLAVLDGRGALLTYHPNFSNVRAAPLGLASEWLEPVATAQFNERLYVLDTEAGQMWRYFPEGDGFYVDEGQRALSLPDLDQAVDAAIYSEDGSVLVLYADGRLRRYGQDSLLWDEGVLTRSGMETPFVAPTHIKIVGRGLNSSVFVADPGTGRIVQLSLGGTFLAQYKAMDEETGEELFTKLSDFDVAETPLRIFVGAEDGLYVAVQE